jgi:hypothetical protein
MENINITHYETNEFFNICLRAKQHKEFKIGPILIFNEREKYILSKFYYSLENNSVSFDNECFEKNYTLNNIEDHYNFYYHHENYVESDTIKWFDFGDKNYWLLSYNKIFSV